MRGSRLIWFALVPLFVLTLSCGNSSNSVAIGENPTGPEGPPQAPGAPAEGGNETGDNTTPTTSITVLLTDDPTDLSNVWVDISEVYLQGGDASGRVQLFAGQTGYIELLALADDFMSLAESIEIPAGRFGQLRVVVDAAAIELENGEVYITKGAEPPAGVAAEDVTGQLVCPSCSSSGFKVILQGRDLSLIDREEVLVIDFNVKESFLRQTGNSGKWMLKPVIKLFDSLEDAE